MINYRTMINYAGTMHPILREGHFNNYMGKYLNPELYKILCPFEIGTDNSIDSFDIAGQFAAKYGVSNLGELVGTFGQRYVVDNVIDFRTILFFVTNSVNKDTSIDYYLPRYGLKENPLTQKITTEQLRHFYNQSKLMLITKYDFIAAATLLQAPGFIIKDSAESNEYVNQLLYLTFEQLLGGELDFEETVYGLFSCISCLNSLNKASIPYPQEKELKETLSKLFDTITIKPCTNIENTSVYLMLAYILETEAEYASSKQFKNKNNYKILRKILSLTKKAFKAPELQDTCDFIGISTNIGKYLNYLAYQNLEFMNYKVARSQLSQSTGNNIKDNIVRFLENDTLLPDFIFSIIHSAVTRQISLKNEPPAARVNDFFTRIYSGTISKANLNVIVSRYRLNNFKEFMQDPRWSHLIDIQSGETLVNNNQHLNTVRDVVTTQVVEAKQTYTVAEQPKQEADTTIQESVSKNTISDNSTLTTVNAAVKNIPSENTQTKTTKIKENFTWGTISPIVKVF